MASLSSYISATYVQRQIAPRYTGRKDENMVRGKRVAAEKNGRRQGQQRRIVSKPTSAGMALASPKRKEGLELINSGHRGEYLRV